MSKETSEHAILSNLHNISRSLDILKRMVENDQGGNVRRQISGTVRDIEQMIRKETVKAQSSVDGL